MSNSWLKTFKDSKEKLLYDIVALKVYNDIAQKIADDKSLSSADSRGRKLYIELENKYDKTSDAFIKLVIAQSFVTGEYQVATNLSKFETLDVYKGNSGKRYNDFSKQIYDSAAKKIGLIIGDINLTLNHLSSDFHSIPVICCRENQEVSSWALLQAVISPIEGLGKSSGFERGV